MMKGQARRGASGVSYGLVLGLIGIVALTAVQGIGSSVRESMVITNEAIQGATLERVSFAPLSDLTAGEVGLTSNTVILQQFNGSLPASVSGGQMLINGTGSPVASANVTSGTSVQLIADGPDSEGETRVVTLRVGQMRADWQLSTTSVVAVSFDPTDVNSTNETGVTSAEIVLEGFDGSIPISVSSGGILIDGSSTPVMSTNVVSGTRVQLVGDGPSGFGQSNTVQFRYGPLTAEWTVRTPDLPPCGNATFTHDTSGAESVAVPLGCNTFIVTAVAGGGGGGGGGGSSMFASGGAGGGGGSGACIEAAVFTLADTQDLSITVGTGGSRGTSRGRNGGTGSNGGSGGATRIEQGSTTLVSLNAGMGGTGGRAANLSTAGSRGNGGNGGTTSTQGALNGQRGNNGSNGVSGGSSSQSVSGGSGAFDACSISAIPNSLGHGGDGARAYRDSRTSNPGTGRNGYVQIQFSFVE